MCSMIALVLGVRALVSFSQEIAGQGGWRGHTSPVSLDRLESLDSAPGLRTYRTNSRVKRTGFMVVERGGR